MSANDLLTVSDVAGELGVHPKTVQRLIDAKKLRACRLSPRKTRVRRADLDAYLKKTWTMPVAA